MLTLQILVLLACACLILQPVDSQSKLSLPKCSSKSDTMFLLDSSSSVGKTNFQIMLNTAVQLSDSYKPIGPQANQVGVQIFSTSTSIKIRLKDHNSFDTLKDAILNIKYLGGSTDTYRGLTVMCFMAFSSRNGGRRRAPNVGIVMTDGYSNKPALTRSVARRCRSSGIKLIAIPIGNDINMKEILAITGAKDQVLPASNFKELLTPGFLQKLANLRCKITG